VFPSLLLPIRHKNRGKIDEKSRKTKRAEWVLIDFYQSDLLLGLLLILIT
jgi:hypothetical protein